MVLGHRQHTPGPGSRIVKRNGQSRLGHSVVVFDKHQIDHQPDNLARRKMLPGRFVRELGEPADQLLEDVAHQLVVDPIGMQVDVGELFRDHIQQVGLGEPFDLGMEIETLEDVPKRQTKTIGCRKTGSRGYCPGRPSAF